MTVKAASPLKYRYNNYDGTEYGVYAFAEEILDIDFYSDGVTVYNTIRGLDISDGYEFKDGPAFEYRHMYWGSLSRDEFSTGDTYQKGWGFAHTIYQLIGFGDAGSENPCLTDEANLSKIEETFLANITPEHDHFCVGQNDSGSYCNCANCQAVYREEGCRGGTMFRLVNRLAEVAEKNGCGHVEIHTLAYDYTFKPTWYLFAPAGLPADVNAILCDAFAKAVEDPDFIATMQGLNINVTYLDGPATLQSFEDQKVLIQAIIDAG